MLQLPSVIYYPYNPKFVCTKEQFPESLVTLGFALMEEVAGFMHLTLVIDSCPYYLYNQIDLTLSI